MCGTSVWLDGLLRCYLIAALMALMPGAAGGVHAAETGLPGLEIFTHETQSDIESGVAGLRFEGQVTRPLALELERLLIADGKPRYKRVMLELNSEGGELGAVKQVVGVLKTIRSGSDVSTRVMDGKMCASGCLAVFMQGRVRKASTSSIWVFHGACKADTNVPSLAATNEYLDLLVASGVNPGFTCTLVQEGYVTRPGAFFLSGYELFHNYDAGIITELLPNWRPEEPRGAWMVVPQ